MILLLLIPSFSWSQGQEKMSGYVRQLVMKYQNSQTHGRRNSKAATSAVPCITAFVKTSDVSELKQQGCSIYASWDDIYIAAIPLNRVSALCSKSSVKRIEAGRSCMATNDNSADITHAREAWDMNPQLPLKGKDVVVGVMDIGFDLTHPNWYSADMQTYRIKQVWDMLDFSEDGEPVVGKTDAGEDTIHVGRQYIGREAILEKRHTADALLLNHGTHTMGTAAGSGRETDGVCQYAGMAPEADLCVVSNYTTNNESVISEKEKYRYTTATDMLGFKYIFDYAESVGKPCVINFSEGCHEDLKESAMYYEVLNKMVGPGRIICSSAGNEGTTNAYFHKPEGVDRKGAFLKSQSQEASYIMESETPVCMQLTFYQDNAKVLEREYDLARLAAFPDSTHSDTIRISEDSLVITLATYPSCHNKNLLATELSVKDLRNKVFGQNTTVSLAVLNPHNDIEVRGVDGSFTTNALDDTLHGIESSHNIFFPGSAECVICVGATSHITTVQSHTGAIYGDNLGTGGVRSSFSSVGPTWSGNIKPDIMAPGVNIVSSMNSYMADQHLAEKYGSRVFEYEGRKHYWALSKGTSMSCPIVTGIIALWLQVCPTLTPDQIRDVFAHTSSHYDEALAYPNNHYGYGEIDALAGIEYINRKYTGIETPNQSSRDMESCSIYSITGMKVHPTALKGREGIYIISDGKKVVKYKVKKSIK